MLILLTFCFGCQDEANPKFPEIEVAINDTCGVAISDSIYFITADALPNVVTVTSEVPEANLLYSVNNAALTMRANDPITLQKQDTVLQFYLTKRNYNDSELRTIVLQEHSDKYLNKVEVSSPVADSKLSISMNDKSRGIVEIEIFTVTGQRLLHRNHLKKADSFIVMYSLAEYQKGIYLVSATYGESKKAYKFVIK